GGRPHVLQEGKVVGEFGISWGVGEIGAGRYIQVMNRDGIAKPRALAEHGRNVAAVALAAKRLDVEAFERQTGKHHDAVITLLSVKGHVVVAQALETLERKPVVRAFGFLQTQDVGPNCFHESCDAIDAQADRIDIPRWNRQPHRDLNETSVVGYWRSLGARSSANRQSSDFADS